MSNQTKTEMRAQVASISDGNSRGLKLVPDTVSYPGLLFALFQWQNRVMSKKTLNKANLAALGADRLADLMLEVSTGSAEIKRRLRLELSHNLGPQELARDVRKRLVSLRKSRGFVSWRKRKSLINDLNTQVEMITEKIAPEEPTEAFDLLWQFIELASSVYERVDDSRGEVGDVFRDALQRFENIAPRAIVSPQVMAARVWDAVLDNGYGEFDGIISLLAPALGDAGLMHLKVLVQAYEDTPLPDEPDEHAAIHFLRDLRSTGGNYAAEEKARFIKRCFQEIAEVQGDTDAYIAQYSDQDLTRPDIAAEVAHLFLAEDRANDAMNLLQAADLGGRTFGREAWDNAYIACLIALDRLEDAQNHRWACFAETLNAKHLRDYLKVLPDFDDIEVEDQAKAHAQQFSDLTAALCFFLDWPDLVGAAQLIETRAEDLNGDFYQLLAPASEREYRAG